MVVGFLFPPPPLLFPRFVIQKGMQACVPATQSIDCFCLQRGCCQVAARVESGFDTGLLGSGRRHAPPLARAAPPLARAAPGLASPPAARPCPAGRASHARAPSQAAELRQGRRGLGRGQERAPRRRRCPLRLPLAPAPAAPPARLRGAALLGSRGWRPGQGQAGPSVGHGAEEPPQIPSQAPGQPRAVVVRVRLCPRLGPPGAGELILHSASDLEDAPGRESEVWWCRQLSVMCPGVCLMVYSGNFICKGKLSAGSYLCLGIASLLPVKIVGCSWKGFLVKVFWFVPPGSADFIFHCGV